MECRPSWAPPISWPYFPPAVGHLPSVDSLIAFTGKKSKSGNGVLKLRRGAEVMKLRTAAIGSAEVGQGCPRSPSGYGGGQARQPSQDHHRPLRPDSRRAIRGRNECSAGHGRKPPCGDLLEVRQPMLLDALITSPKGVTALEPCCDWLHVELSPGWQQALSYSPALHQHLLV